jgi:phosphoglycerate dehydrogenase-like enzyme
MTYQRNHEWPPDRNVRLAPIELRDSTIGIIGYGSIGREIARLVQPLGVKVLATKKNVLNPEDRGFTIENLGDPEGNLFTRLYPIQAIKSLVKECDFIVVTLPKTKETLNLISEPEFGAMKTGAFIIDVSSGGIIKTGALINAFKEKRIGGAVLDVFEQEPLPKDHPLWDLPNLIITPHIAGVSIRYNERAVLLIKENLDRYIKNSSLLNIFSQDLGY